MGDRALLEVVSPGIDETLKAERLLKAIFKRAMAGEDREKADALKQIEEMHFLFDDLWNLTTFQGAYITSSFFDGNLAELANLIQEGHGEEARQLEKQIKQDLSAIFNLVQKILKMIDELPVELRVDNYRNFSDLRSMLFERVDIFRLIDSFDLSRLENIQRARQLLIVYCDLAVGLLDSVAELSTFIKEKDVRSAATPIGDRQLMRPWKRPVIMVAAIFIGVLALVIYFTYRTPSGIVQVNGDSSDTIAWISLAVAILSFLTALIGFIQKLVELRAADRK